MNKPPIPKKFLKNLNLIMTLESMTIIGSEMMKEKIKK